MPRMIDADALTSVLEEWEEKACDGTENDGSDGTTRVLHPVPMTTREIIDLIADQPTIEAEPVKHGRWVDRYGGKYVNPKYECSECRKEAPYRPKLDDLLNWSREQDLSDYCPNCGAKMDGGADHE